MNRGLTESQLETFSSDSPYDHMRPISSRGTRRPMKVARCGKTLHALGTLFERLLPVGGGLVGGSVGGWVSGVAVKCAVLVVIISSGSPNRKLNEGMSEGGVTSSSSALSACRYVEGGGGCEVGAFGDGRLVVSLLPGQRKSPLLTIANVTQISKSNRTSFVANA